MKGVSIEKPHHKQRLSPSLFCFIVFRDIKGKINNPSLWRKLFSVVPPINSLISVSDPWRDFWADTLPFQGPKPHLMRCFRSFRDTRSLSGWCRCLRTTSKRTDANLLLLKNTLANSWFRKANNIESSLWPDLPASFYCRSCPTFPAKITRLCQSQSGKEKTVNNLQYTEIGNEIQTKPCFHLALKSNPGMVNEAVFLFSNTKLMKIGKQ